MTQVVKHLLYKHEDLSLTHSKNVGTRLEPHCCRKNGDSGILGVCWPATQDSGWAPHLMINPVSNRRSGKNYGRNPKSTPDFHTHRGTPIQIYIYILNHTPIRKKFSMQIKHGSLKNFHLWLPGSLSVSISYRKVNIGIPIPIARAPAQSCIWFGDLCSHRCSLEDVCTLDNLKTNYPNLEETKVASFSNSWMTNGILVSKSNGIACIHEKVSLRAMSRPGWFFD